MVSESESRLEVLALLLCEVFCEMELPLILIVSALSTLAVLLVPSLLTEDVLLTESSRRGETNELFVDPNSPFGWPASMLGPLFPANVDPKR